jgi:hypothetical protein
MDGHAVEGGRDESGGGIAAAKRGKHGNRGLYKISEIYENMKIRIADLWCQLMGRQNNGLDRGGNYTSSATRGQACREESCIVRLFIHKVGETTRENVEAGARREVVCMRDVKMTPWPRVSNSLTCLLDE